jgi:ketosteroid isomerase-like protein
MSEESTTPDLVELVREAYEAADRRDIDVLMSIYAPDAVLEAMGMGTSFEGVTAIRGFHEDFTSAYEEYGIEPEEILDLGNGVVFAAFVQQGRLVGSSAHVQMRGANVGVFADGLLVRQTLYTDIDEARAAAERLAEERADG